MHDRDHRAPLCTKLSIAWLNGCATAAFAALGIDAQETPAEDETESAPNDTEDAGEEPKAQRKAKSSASRTAAPRSRDGSHTMTRH